MAGRRRGGLVIDGGWGTWGTWPRQWEGPGPKCQFLEKEKANVPTSPGWIWGKNMGFGKLGVINSQKRLPSGLKIEADILSRSR